MPKRLTALRLHELSLVDEGANEGADIVVIKRRNVDEHGNELDEHGKPKKKTGSLTGNPTNPGAIQGDPATSSANAGPAPAGDAVSKIRIAMLQHLPDFATELVAKALAASPAADPNAAALAAASITEIFMDLKELSTALEKAEADNVVLKQRADTAEARVAELETTVTKQKADLEAVQKGRTTSLTPEQEDEEFLKSLPAGARNRILADRAATKQALESVEKMREQQDNLEAIAKAREIGTPEPEAIGPLLARVRKGKTTAEDADKLEGVLKAAGAQAREGGLYRSAGVSAGAAANADDPEAQLNAKADEIAKSKGISHAKAYEQAMKDHPELYNAYVAKRRG
jgi:hypothetical protein